MNFKSNPISIQVPKFNSQFSVAIVIVAALAFSTVSATSFAASPSAKPTVSSKPSAKATTKATPKVTTKPTVSAKPSAKVTPKVTTKPTGVASPGAGGGRARGGGGAFANLSDADKSCLAENGFTVPEGGGNRVRPSDAPSGVRPSGAPGMGGGRGAGNDPALITSAFSACGLEAPKAAGQNPDPVGVAPKASKTPTTPAKTTAVAVSAKQAAFVKCMTAAKIKTAGAALAYDQSDPDTALALVKCQKSTGFVLPKKK